MNNQNYEYSAFISYRHLDTSEPGQAWAEWVQTLLERYTTPPELAGQESLYGDPVPATMPRVFRDKDQLPAHGDLGGLIHDALEKSRVLVVLCTPDAVKSPWVADEIHYFKKLGRADRIIAIVLRGKPHALDPAEECYPPPLRHKLHADGTVNTTEKEHPIYIDLRPPLGEKGATTPEDYRSLLQAADIYKDAPIKTAVAKHTIQLNEARILLLSGVLGLTPRELTQRDLLRRIEEEKQRTEVERRTRRRRMRIALAVIAVLLGLCGWAWWERGRAKAANATASKERDTAQQMLIAKNEQEKRANNASFVHQLNLFGQIGLSLDKNMAKQREQRATDFALQQLRFMRSINLLLAKNESHAASKEINAWMLEHANKLDGFAKKGTADYLEALTVTEKAHLSLKDNKQSDAMEFYLMALRQFESLSDRAPNDLALLDDIARTHDYIGALHQERREFSEALSRYQKSIEIADKVVASENPPSEAYFSAALAKTRTAQILLQIEPSKKTEVIRLIQTARKNLASLEGIAGAEDDMRFLKATLEELEQQMSGAKTR